MTKRVLIGAFPDGGYGLRVSQPGYDVTSNPVDNEKLVFNSDWVGLLPVHVTGTTTCNATTVSVPFPNLGYIPFCAALINVGSGTQLYQTAQDFLNKNKTVNAAIGTQVDASPVYEFSNTGNVYWNAEIKMFGNSVSFTTNVNATFYWVVYRRRAF